MRWYEELYSGIDAMDLGVIDRLCTEDTTVRIGNHPAAEGREAVRAALGGFWSTIAGLEHQLVDVVEDGDRTVIEAVVTYTRLDGRAVAIPAATAIERRGGLVASQRVYLDLAPLDGS